MKDYRPIGCPKKITPQKFILSLTKIKESFETNTIRDGESTALYTANTVDTVDTVYTLYTIEAASHFLNSSVYVHLYITGA